MREHVSESTTEAVRTTSVQRAPDRDRGGLLALQRSAGNAAVLSLLGGQPAPAGPSATVGPTSATSDDTVRRFVWASAFKAETRLDAASVPEAISAQQQVADLLLEYGRLGKDVEMGGDAYPRRVEVEDHELLQAVVLVRRMKAVVDGYLDDDNLPPNSADAAFRTFSVLCDIEIDDLEERIKGPPAKEAEAEAPVDTKAGGVRAADLKLEGSLASAMDMMGAVVSRLAPHTGDHGEAKPELSTPVAPAVSVDVAFLFEVKRLDGEDDGPSPTEVNCEITVGATLGAAPAKLQAAIGGFMKSQANTPEEALQLISYGLYRRCKESSVIPKELSSYLWSGATDAKADAQADLWSRMVEEQVFTDEHAFVETGMKGEVGIELGDADSLGVGAALTGFAGTRHDKQSLDNSAKGGPGELNTKTSASGEENRYAQQSTGRTSVIKEATAKVAFGPFSGEVKYGVAQRAEGADQELAGDGTYWEIRASAKTALPGLANLVSYAPSVLRSVMLRLEGSNEQQTTSTKVAEAATAAYSAADVVTLGITQMPITEALTKFEGPVEEGEPTSAIASEVGVELYIEVNNEGPKATDVVIDLKSLKETGAGVPGFIKAELTRRSRIAGVVLPKGADWRSTGSWKRVW